MSVVPPPTYRCPTQYCNPSPLLRFGDAHKNGITEEDFNKLEIYLEPYTLALDNEVGSVPVKVWFILGKPVKDEHHIVAEIFHEGPCYSERYGNKLDLERRGVLLHWHVVACSKLYFFDIAINKL